MSYNCSSPKPKDMHYEYNYEANFFIPTWVIILACVFALIEIIAMWKVFTKAGQPGWASLIPIYNIYIMTKITGKPGIWVLLMFIPLVNIVFGIWLLNMISKSFGHDEGSTATSLIFFLFFSFSRRNGNAIPEKFDPPPKQPITTSG